MSKEIIIKTVESLLNEYDQSPVINKIQDLSKIKNYITKLETDLTGQFVKELKGKVSSK